jgi:hypothetical protein
MSRPLIAIAIIFCVFSCKKNDGDDINPQDKEKAAQLQTFVDGNSFRLAKYYSLSPIDYIDTDQVVKSETELWIYVSEWLHDDEYLFNAGGTVSIKQNAKKIEWSDSEVLTKNYKIEADKDGVGLKFVGHEYQPLDYRLISFNDTMLKVSAKWNGKEVISEYNLLQ